MVACLVLAGTGQSKHSRDTIYYHVITLMSSLNTLVTGTWGHVIESQNCGRIGLSLLLIPLGQTKCLKGHLNSRPMALRSNALTNWAIETLDLSRHLNSCKALQLRALIYHRSPCLWKSKSWQKWKSYQKRKEMQWWGSLMKLYTQGTGQSTFLNMFLEGGFK